MVGQHVTAGPLAGTDVAAVETRGKHLLVHGADGRSLHVHLGMHGRVRLTAAGAGRGPHVLRTAAADVVIAGTSRVEVRRRGDLRLGLGPDLLGERLRRRRLPAPRPPVRPPGGRAPARPARAGRHRQHRPGRGAVGAAPGSVRARGGPLRPAPARAGRGRPADAPGRAWTRAAACPSASTAPAGARARAAAPRCAPSCRAGRCRGGSTTAPAARSVMRPARGGGAAARARARRAARAGRRRCARRRRRVAAPRPDPRPLRRPSARHGGGAAVGAGRVDRRHRDGARARLQPGREGRLRRGRRLLPLRHVGAVGAQGHRLDRGRRAARAPARADEARAAAAELPRRERRAAAPGNGSLMRTAPIGIRYRADAGALERISRLDSSLTHHDPLAGDACAWLNLTLAALLRGRKLPQLDIARRRARRRLRSARRPSCWRPRRRSRSGYVLTALRIGFAAAFGQADLESAVVFAVNLGGDADTNGAVAGALAGARFGAGAIPERWIEPLLARERIGGLANRLRAGLASCRALRPQEEDEGRFAARRLDPGQYDAFARRGTPEVPGGVRRAYICGTCDPTWSRSASSRSATSAPIASKTEPRAVRAGAHDAMAPYVAETLVTDLRRRRPGCARDRAHTIVPLTERLCGAWPLPASDEPAGTLVGQPPGWRLHRDGRAAPST